MKCHLFAVMPLREIDNGQNAVLQRSSCFTCGNPHHLAKECPSRLSRGPERGLFDSASHKPRDDEVGQIHALVKNGKRLGGQKSKCGAISAAEDW